MKNKLNYSTFSDKYCQCIQVLVIHKKSWIFEERSRLENLFSVKRNNFPGKISQITLQAVGLRQILTETKQLLTNKIKKGIELDLITTVRVGKTHIKGKEKSCQTRGKYRSQPL